MRRLAKVSAPPFPLYFARPGIRRWMRFNVVGAIGIVVQITMLALLVRVAGLHYEIATPLAVETAIIHNFLWHRHWTWRDRPAVAGTRLSCALKMLLKFNLANGMLSIAGNILLMRLLVGGIGLGVIEANLATIALCSLINYLLADRIVFV